MSAKNYAFYHSLGATDTKRGLPCEALLCPSNAVMIWNRFCLRFHATRAQTNIAKQRNTPPTTARAIIDFVLLFRSEAESSGTGRVEGDNYGIDLRFGFNG
jgi:hypothetical protein